MKRYITLVICSVILFSFLSCDDFLDNKPKRTVLLKSLDDYDKLLNARTVSRTLSHSLCYMTDDVLLLDSDDKFYLSLDMVGIVDKNLYMFEENIFEGTLDNSWDFCYESIYTYNTILEGVYSANTGTQTEKDNVYGEALLGRAFQYHQLLITYSKAYDPKGKNDHAGVPLMLVPDIESGTLTRTSVDSVYNLIISDTEQAIEMLPSKPSPNAFRGSVYAAYAFLARVYLHRGDYPKALEYAELALKSYSPLINLNEYKIVKEDSYAGRNNVPERLYNPESLYIWDTSAYNSMSSRTYVSSDLIDLFDKENDRRFKLYMTDKFENIESDHYIWIPAMFGNLGIGTPEVYLTAAECNARLGNIDLAMEQLNTLRENRYENYVPLAATSAKEATKLVLEERRRELMMIPGMRLGDIKRLAFDPDFKQSIKRTALGKNIEIQPNSNKLTLLIPDVVMDYNTGMEQNSRVD